MLNVTNTPIHQGLPTVAGLRREDLQGLMAPQQLLGIGGRDLIPLAREDPVPIVEEQDEEHNHVVWESIGMATKEERREKIVGEQDEDATVEVVIEL